MAKSASLLLLCGNEVRVQLSGQYFQMRIHVQDPFTLCFWCNDGTWSRDVVKAMDFLNNRNAVSFCSSHLERLHRIVLHESKEVRTRKSRRGGMPKTRSKPDFLPSVRHFDQHLLSAED